MYKNPISQTRHNTIEQNQPEHVDNWLDVKYELPLLLKARIRLDKQCRHSEVSLLWHESIFSQIAGCTLKMLTTLTNIQQLHHR